MDLLIFGFGGHGKVVIDLARALGYGSVGVFDDRPAVEMPQGVVYLGPYDPTVHPDVPLVMAIGDNAARMRLSAVVGHSFAKLIHPSASVSQSAMVGEGTVVLHNAVIQSGSAVGRHCIINVGAVIDHDCRVGDFCHLRPNSYVAGGCLVSDKVTIEPGVALPRFTSL